MWGRWTNLTMLCSPVINDQCLRIYIRSHFFIVIFNVQRTDFFGDSCRLCCCGRSHHLSSFYTFMTCFTSVIISFEILNLESIGVWWIHMGSRHDVSFFIRKRHFCVTNEEIHVSSKTWNTVENCCVPERHENAPQPWCLKTSTTPHLNVTRAFLFHFGN